jgi:hypothetical protein
MGMAGLEKERRIIAPRKGATPLFVKQPSGQSVRAIALRGAARSVGAFRNHPNGNYLYGNPRDARKGHPRHPPGLDCHAPFGPRNDEKTTNHCETRSAVAISQSRHCEAAIQSWRTAIFSHRHCEEQNGAATHAAVRFAATLGQAERLFAPSARILPSARIAVRQDLPRGGVPCNAR